MRYFICEICGNLVDMIEESIGTMTCCGQDMTELIPGTSDGASEKHVPVITQAYHGVTVAVGSQAHPMMKEHHIEWIALETEKGVQRKKLHPGEKPCAAFLLTEEDAPVAAYAYCNLHGLWKSDTIHI